MQDTFMKKHLNTSAVLGTLIAVLGIYMMFQGESFTKVFVSILGVVLVFSGAHTLFSMGTFELGHRNKIALLIKSLLSIVIGLIAIIVPFATAVTSWNVLLYVLGAELLISAFISLVEAMLLRKGAASVSSLVSEGMFSLVIAVLLFAFPRQIGEMLLKLVGVVLIASGVGIVVWSVRIKKLTRQFNNAPAIEVTAEVVDEPGSGSDKS